MTRSPVKRVVRTIRMMDVIKIPSPQSGVPLGMSSAMERTVKEILCEQFQQCDQKGQSKKKKKKKKEGFLGTRNNQCCMT